MGDAIAKQFFFPAPESLPRSPRLPPVSSNIIWDERPKGQAGGGVRRPFLWLPAEKRTATSLIYFHANGEDLSFAEDHLMDIGERLNLNVLGVEYPGYGLCRGQDRLGCVTLGTNTVRGINSAAVHALQFLVSTLGVAAERVLLHGHCIGSGPALGLAKYAQDNFCWNVGGVVLQSPFADIKQLASDHVGTVGSLLCPNYWDNLQTIKHICGDESSGGVRPAIPLLVVHGQRDVTCLPYHGQMLYEEALRHGHPAAQAVFPETATHDCFESLDDLLGPISEFMSRHMRRDVAPTSFKCMFPHLYLGGCARP